MQGFVTQKRLGNMVENGFKKQSWTAIVTGVKLHTPENMEQLVNEKKCRSKFDAFKKQWRAWVAITTASGWSVDERDLPSNSPEVMETYFEKHEEARFFKTKTLPFKEELFELCEGKTATGRRAGGIQRILTQAAGHNVDVAPAKEADPVDVDEVGGPQKINMTGDPSQDTADDLAGDRAREKRAKERPA